MIKKLHVSVGPLNPPNKTFIKYVLRKFNFLVCMSSTSETWHIMNVQPVFYIWVFSFHPLFTSLFFNDVAENYAPFTPRHSHVTVRHVLMMPVNADKSFEKSTFLAVKRLNI